MKIPELLSPAGSYEGLVSAVQSGADAVYLGLTEFSARKGAPNFTLEELGRGIYYAHLHEVRVYVTLNTLVTDTELSYVRKLAQSADRLGADAFIIQDMGLAKELSGNVRAELHASTQMTVINKEGADVLSKSGFTRVVPARELSLEEIKTLCEGFDGQVEVFCHGALCMSYSGQCMMSRFIGFDGREERSGNRGSCAQPCRMKYELLLRDNETLTAFRQGCRLSPGDLCSLSYLEKLVSTGVSSLKIEGRLKKPEYCGLVTMKYRKALDAIKNGTPLKDISEDLYDLSTQFSRGGFSSGHQLGKMPLSAITFDSPGHGGALCGKVISDPKKLTSPVPLYSVKVALSGRISKGDSLIFGKRFEDNSDRSGNINIIYKEKNRVNGAEKGDVVLLTVSGELLGIKKGYPVYRTQDGPLTSELVGLYKGTKENRKVEISGYFTCKTGEKACLEFVDRFGNKTSVYSAKESLSQSSGALTEDSVRKQVEKLGNTPFILKNFRCDIDKDTFLPLSEVNEMRRGAASALELLKGKVGRL